MPASLQPVTASAEVLPGVLGLRQASLDGPFKSIEAKQLADLLFCRGGCQAVKAGDIDNGPHLPQVNFTEQHTGHFCSFMHRAGSRWNPTQGFVTCHICNAVPQEIEGGHGLGVIKT